MRKTILITIILVLGLFFVISGFSYPKQEERTMKSFAYDDRIPKEEGTKKNAIILQSADAVLQNAHIDDEEAELYAEHILLSTGEHAEWAFDVEEEGEYTVCAGYFPLEGNGQDFTFALSVTDSDETYTPIQSWNALTLTRLWSDTGEFQKTGSGDEIRPKQMEKQIWTEEKFKEKSETDAKLWLEPGRYTLTLTGGKEECLISYVCLYQEEMYGYSEYVQAHAGALDLASPKEVFYKEQAETPILRSSALLYALYDRSSPYTTPYDASHIRYNIIGGSNWSKEGQWIEWEFEVEEDGFYQIGLRFRQNQNKGVTSARQIYIDGETLFEELSHVTFPYNVSWQNAFIGGEEPYRIYLTKGKHTIRMEVVLGDLKDITRSMTDTIDDLNALYREIIMITGVEPDMYRDYHLETAIPELDTKLNALLEDLSEYERFLENLYGENSYATRILSQLKRQIDSFVEKPYTIQKRLSMFRTNISAFAEWVYELVEQPLDIDCFYITGTGGELPRAEGGAFLKTGHEMHAFIGSFFREYSEVSGDKVDEEAVTIKVWVGKGRDQANVIKRLVDEYFTPQTGINVDISLVEGALVKAAIAGKGPDVNIFTSRGEAMNLAFRGALLPLDEQAGFEGMRSEYMEHAFIPYTYEGNVYAVPEEQDFNMMFVRTDIFEELGIAIPETWDDLMEILPVIQAANLTIGLPYESGSALMNAGIGVVNIFPTLLTQQGISVYTEDGSKTNLASADAYTIFKMWTDFYAMYDLPLYKDNFNRFRTGEIPVLIASYKLHNTLTKAAQEIAGQWVMVEIPGMEQEDGSMNHASTAGGICSIVLKDTKHEEAAWEFVRWWNSAEVQELYSKDIEAELSILGRHTPANVQAFMQTYWYDEEKEILMKSLGDVVEIPEVPGGYYVSRNIDNAFRDVYYNGENARESLYYWMNAVDEELLRKQTQLKNRR